ncbi:MAG: zinc ribbon domain-containing protein [Erysipelotrichaceae bacterium]|nr:zinc ribbon domain-containing protein [Erysipelotrichaceae bacterium]
MKEFKYCPYCGFELKEGYNYCPSCGNNLNHQKITELELGETDKRKNWDTITALFIYFLIFISYGYSSFLVFFGLALSIGGYLKAKKGRAGEIELSLIGIITGILIILFSYVFKRIIF